MAFSRRICHGSLALPLIVSFFFGVFSCSFILSQSSATVIYEGDYISVCVLGPLGALCGFLVFSCAHELAQFFAARFAGLHVRALILGAGTPLARFLLLGVPCVVGNSLLGGVVSYIVTNKRHPRLKIFFTIASGIIAPLALAAVLFWIAHATFPQSPETSATARRLYAFLLGMTAAIFISVPGIVIPYRYLHRGKWVRSDTMQLLTLPWKTDAEIERQILAAQTLMNYEIDPLIFSLLEAQEKVASHPNSSIALRTAIMYLRPSFDTKLPDYYRRLVALAQTPAERLRCIDEYLTYCLESDCVTANALEMDAFSVELLASDPNNLSLRGTRGGILVDLGRRDEGVAMLSDVVARSDAAIDQCYSSVFLALAAKSAGDLQSAKEYAFLARKADADCLALQRISDLLVPAGKQSPSATTVST